jgi:uncharacterized membrane protein YjfL (UPF0719 family)
MWRIVGNIAEMFVYASVYMIIAVIGLKIVGATLSADFEKRVSENDTGFCLIAAALFVGLSLVLAAVIK